FTAEGAESAEEETTRVSRSPSQDMVFRALAHASLAEPPASSTLLYFSALSALSAVNNPGQGQRQVHNTVTANPGRRNDAIHENTPLLHHRLRLQHSPSLYGISSKQG